MVGMRPTSSSARLLTKSLNAGEPTSTEAAPTVKLVWLCRTVEIDQRVPAIVRKAALRHRNTDGIDGKSDRRLSAAAAPNARPPRVQCASGPTT
jgi:hypothetical protein